MTLIKDKNGLNSGFSVLALISTVLFCSFHQTKRKNVKKKMEQGLKEMFALLISRARTLFLWLASSIQHSIETLSLASLFVAIDVIKHASAIEALKIPFKWEGNYKC